MVIFAVMRYNLNLHTYLFPANSRLGIGICKSLNSCHVPLARICVLFQFYCLKLILTVMRRQYRSIKANVILKYVPIVFTGYTEQLCMRKIRSYLATYLL